jgi:hypothetical protein
MAPSCALDEAGMRMQRERYRVVGADARLVERSASRLVVEIDGQVAVARVEEVIAVERECCPFFMLDWEQDARRLTVSGSQAEHEPALNAIAFALDLEIDVPPVSD